MRAAVAACTLLLACASARAQEPAVEERREGELQKFINPDAGDVLTKLEVLQHALYEVDQKLTLLEFRARHGERVRIEPILFPNVDHDLTPGYLFTPVGLEQGKRYPGLVLVHGGYHWSFAEEFFSYVARAIEEGYVAIFPEYRGSRGYGAEHYRAQDYGGKDVDDVLWAAAHLARQPYVDPERLGIVGRSRGGMLTLLALAREPERFKAAGHIVGLVDFIAYMSYKPDYRREDIAKIPRFGGLPFENLPEYIETSPITHVARIETPLLVHATTHDRTVPVELHAERLVEALKAHGKTYEYELYERAPGGHGYAYGDTEQSRDSMRRLFAFLARYLKQ